MREIKAVCDARVLPRERERVCLATFHCKNDLSSELVIYSISKLYSLDDDLQLVDGKS